MSDKSRTYIENRYRRFSRFSCNDFVTELCLKWAFECLSVVHRIKRKSPVKHCFTGLVFNALGFSGETGIRTPGTSRYNGFQDRRNRPLCHLSKTLLESCLVFQRRCKGTQRFLFSKFLEEKIYPYPLFFLFRTFLTVFETF